VGAPTLRALAAVAPEPYGARARRAADRVARTGVVEPPWSALVGTAEPTVAWLHFDSVDDDGEVIELARDPANWGPAKTIGLAVQQRGIDITDQAALDDFIAEVNRTGGIDVLANALAKR